MDEKTDRRSIEKSSERASDEQVQISDESVRGVARAQAERSSKRSSVINVLVSGFGLLSDGYNIQIIGYMNVVLTDLYPDAQTTAMKTRLSNSALVGEVVGMLLFGLCIDRWGRKLGMFATTLLLVFGITLATAAHGRIRLGCCCLRGIAGVGAGEYYNGSAPRSEVPTGGEYSVCATQATEAADENDYVRKRRGILVGSATIVSLNSGFISASIVSIIVIAAYGGKATNGVWRVCFGVGIFLPLVIFLFRLRIVNSTQFHKHAIRDKRKFPLWLAVKRYWKPLLGCAGTWFLYDFITYPFGLLTPTIVAGFGSQTLLESTGWSALVGAFSLPGAIAGGFLIDRIGRRQTFAFGFSLVAVFAFILGGAMVPLRAKFPAFVVLFGLFNTFLSLGPGICTFLVSTESFPTPLRGHFLGVSAAMGKVGVAIGTQVFPSIIASYPTEIKGQQVAFLIGAGIAVLSTSMVLTLIPDREKQLESEDALFKAYLEERGWDTSRMGLITED
ncbi:major facilitator superfamily domain-containing protein [Infundibulicybe gibba]|nr:major facilitator superfamily domain-containing protein [Infundibulicybe gibba]